MGADGCFALDDADNPGAGIGCCCCAGYGRVGDGAEADNVQVGGLGVG